MMKRRQFFGFALVPGPPGLGSDEAFAGKRPYQSKDWSTHEWPDGLVGDH
jgi:hypothetical protein